MTPSQEIIQLIKNFTPDNEVDIVSIVSKQTGYPIAIVKRGILQGQLQINGTPIRKTHIYYYEGSQVTFQGKVIAISLPNRFDRYIDFLLEKVFESKALDHLSSDEKIYFVRMLLTTL